jgi:hypothetical protein
LTDFEREFPEFVSRSPARIWHRAPPRTFTTCGAGVISLSEIFWIFAQVVQKVTNVVERVSDLGDVGLYRSSCIRKSDFARLRGKEWSMGRGLRRLPKAYSLTRNGTTYCMIWDFFLACFFLVF